MGDPELVEQVGLRAGTTVAMTTLTTMGLTPTATGFLGPGGPVKGREPFRGQTGPGAPVVVSPASFEFGITQTAPRINFTGPALPSAFLGPQPSGGTTPSILSRVGDVLGSIVRNGGVGPTGRTGSAGERGAAGGRGERGLPGPRGPRGDVGARGPAGAPGAAGICDCPPTLTARAAALAVPTFNIWRYDRAAPLVRFSR